MTFQKFNARDFIPFNQPKQIKFSNKPYALGGLLQNAISGAMTGNTLAPGVGAIAGGILGLMGGADKAIKEKNAKHQAILSSNKQEANPYGNLQFALGGRTYKYENGDFIEFNGPKHAQGGIPHRGAEVEGGEVEVKIDNNTGFVLSDRIKNPFTGNSLAKDGKRVSRRYKGRDDEISRKTAKLEAQELVNINDTIKDTLAYGGQTKKKYEGGGYIAPTQYGYDPEEFERFDMINKGAPIPTQYGYDANKFAEFEPLNRGINNPLESTLSDQITTPPRGSIQQTMGVDKLPTMTSELEAPSINPLIGISNINVPGDMGTLAKIPKVDSKLNTSKASMTLGDKFQVGAGFIPGVANILRGVLDKPEQVNPTFNQFNQQNLNEINSTGVDFQSLLNQDNLATNALRQSINNSTSGGNRISNLQNAFANQAERRADIKLKEQMANNQLAFQRSGFRNQIGNQNVNASERARLETAANKSARSNLISQGIGDIAQGMTNAGQGLNQSLFNIQTYNQIAAMFPDFTLAEYQEAIKQGKTPADIIRARNNNK